MKSVLLYFDLVKRSLFLDRINFNILIIILTVGGFNLLIWKLRLGQEGAVAFQQLRIAPLPYLGIVALINLLLAVASYDREKEISYLLLSTTLFVTLLIFGLETFYLVNS
ncbi:MAG: hypothetical protein AAB360_04045 [Patescibacteria group bacterium]